ncbi:hypothetical protein ACFVS2_25865 [Brevibacillus sp. NPDC058079]|uniref:hypothetical protein n=1 Tax=Brevibacillus sp. NPDC058079 TaxID=3346330 RepID=UPI0036E767C0
MKAVCPNNPEHKEFITSAHVVQDWIVDESGNYLSVAEDVQTTHGPHKENTWNCRICLAEAIVT